MFAAVTRVVLRNQKFVSQISVLNYAGCPFLISNTRCTAGLAEGTPPSSVLPDSRRQTGTRRLIYKLENEHRTYSKLNVALSSMFPAGLSILALLAIVSCILMCL